MFGGEREWEPVFDYPLEILPIALDLNACLSNIKIKYRNYILSVCKAL